MHAMKLERTKGTLQHDTAHVHLCKQRMYWELCTGEFTGGGTPLSGAAVRKPVWYGVPSVK